MDRKNEKDQIVKVERVFGTFVGLATVPVITSLLMALTETHGIPVETNSELIIKSRAFRTNIAFMGVLGSAWATYLIYSGRRIV